MFPLQDSNHARNFPFVNYSLLLLNVIFFLFEVSMPEEVLNEFIKTYGFVPRRFLEQFGIDQIFTIFSAMFMHGGWLHLLSNMWALHIFGDNVEDKMGHISYFVFYIICGIVAAATQIFVLPDATLPTIGASGALAGVLGGYLLLFPTARIITFIPIFIIPYFIEVPAVLFLGIWFFTQFFTGLGALDASPLAAESGGVAWWAHVGGFLAGMLLVKVFTAKKRHREYYPDEYYPW